LGCCPSRPGWRCAAEQDCCQFFEFAITVDRRGVALEVRAAAEAQPIVESLFGAGDRR
jgi:hypothetical protein